MTAYPWIDFGVALGNSPLDASPTYRDMSRRVNTANTNRPLGQAGTATVVLDNSDGELFQWNTASQFYGNLLDAETADLVTTTGDWNPALNCTLSRSTTQAFHGAGSLKMHATSAASCEAATGSGLSGIPVRPSRAYTASCVFRAVALANFCNIGIRWYDSGGSNIRNDTGSNVTDSTSAWTGASASFTSPSNAAFASVIVKVPFATNTEEHYVDIISLQGGAQNTLWYPGGMGGLMGPDVKVQLAAWWNHLTAQQSDITSGTTGWNSLANAFVTRSTAQTHFSTASLRLEAAGAGQMVAGTDSTTSGRPVHELTTYTASCVFLADTTPRQCFIGIRWWQSDGTFLREDDGINVANTTSAWALAAVVATSPAGAAFADIVIKVNSAAGGERHYAADFSLTPGSGTTVWIIGGPYYQMTGYVNDWGAEWESIRYGDCALTVTDAFKGLTLVKRPRTDYRVAQLASSPAALYGFDETSLSQASGSGTVAAVDSSGNGRDGIYKGEAPNFDVSGALPAEIGTAIGFKRGAANNGSYVELLSAACPTGTGNWSIEAWVRPRSFNTLHATAPPPAPPVDQIWHVFGVGSQSLFFVILDDGMIGLTALDGTNGGSMFSTTALTLGEWNHVVAVKSGTTGPTNWRLYINAVDCSDHAGQTVEGTGNVSVTANAALVGGYEASGVAQGAFDGDMDEVAVYFSALSSGTIATHYAAGFGLVAPALSGTRVGEILDIYGAPAGDRAIDAGQFIMQQVTAPIHDTPPLGLILTDSGSLVESEGWPAAFFISGAGKYTFQDRARATAGSSATFSDSSSTLYYDPGPGPVRNDKNLWTKVVLSATNGQPQTAGTTDPTLDRYFARTLTRTGLQNASDADVATMADLLYARYGTARDRLDKLVIHPIDEPVSMFPQVISRDLNDVITVFRTSMQGDGSTFGGDFRIVGISHDIGGQDWHTTFTLEPI